jgi:hypothetical protein
MSVSWTGPVIVDQGRRCVTVTLVPCHGDVQTLYIDQLEVRNWQYLLLLQHSVTMKQVSSPLIKRESTILLPAIQ